MGGPGASVLLRKPLTQQQENELENWFRLIANQMEKAKWGNGYVFWFREDVFPGTVSRCQFHFSIEGTQTFWDDEEGVQITEALGYLPQQAIGVSSGCNQREDHSTLGDVILHLAETFNGLIYMQGAITPPMKPVNRLLLEEISAEAPERRQEKQDYLKAQLKALRDSLPEGKTIQHLINDPDSPLKAVMTDVEAKYGPLIPPELDWEARRPSLEEISTFVKTLPGTIYGREYAIASGRPWVSHIVDVTFFRTWMQHPHFHMIK